jgi:hypothetical protein
MANTNAAGVQYLGDGNDSGTCLGRTSVSEVGFYGATPTTRRSGASQASVTVTCGTASGSALVASIHSVATANSTLLNQIQADLVAMGLIAGA